MLFMDYTPTQIRLILVGDLMEAIYIVMALRKRAQIRIIHVRYLQPCTSIMAIGYSDLYGLLELSPFSKPSKYAILLVRYYTLHCAHVFYVTNQLLSSFALAPFRPFSSHPSLSPQPSVHQLSFPPHRDLPEGPIPTQSPPRSARHPSATHTHLTQRLLPT